MIRSLALAFALYGLLWNPIPQGVWPQPGGHVAHSGGGGITFTGVQVVRDAAGNCKGGIISCSVPLAAVTAGHLLVVMVFNGSGSADYLNSVTGETMTIPSGAGTCQGVYSSAGATSCAYVISAAGGETSLTLGFNASSSYYVRIYEVSYTGGTPTVDAQNTSNDTTASTSLAGVGLTLSGTSDAIFQVISASGGIAQSIDGSYINFFADAHGANANILNSSSGTAPTWTWDTAQKAIGGAIAFK